MLAYKHFSFAFNYLKFFKQKQDIHKCESCQCNYPEGFKFIVHNTLLPVFGRWLQILLLNFGFYFRVAVEVQKPLT